MRFAQWFASVFAIAISVARDGPGPEADTEIDCESGVIVGEAVEGQDWKDLKDGKDKKDVFHGWRSVEISV